MSNQGNSPELEDEAARQILDGFRLSEVPRAHVGSLRRLRRALVSSFPGLDAAAARYYAWVRQQ